MNEILVDIIVPVYNVENYLDRFFNSLQNQTMQCFKIVVVYDVSQDKSLQIIKKYQKAFKKRFILIENQKKGGLAHARNVGLDSGCITSKYLSFLDPDDYIREDYFEKMILSIEQSNADLAICGFDRYNVDTKQIVSTDMICNPQTIANPRGWSKSIFLNVSVWNKLYKTKDVINYRFDEIQRVEDLTYFIKVFSSSKKIVFVNEPLYCYTIRNDSLSQTFSIDQLDSVLDAIASLKKEKELIDNAYDFVCGVLFLRLCLGVGLRIYSYDKKQYSKARKKCLSCLNNNFAGWKKTKFLSMKVAIKNGKKAMAFYLYKIIFILGLSRMAIWLYHNYSLKKRKEIHW